jgi:hypothetical protein
MKGTVISYVYNIPGADGEVVNDMPYAYRQHTVPDVYDADAISAQVQNERGNVPPGTHLTWTR